MTAYQEYSPLFLPCVPCRSFDSVLLTGIIDFSTTFAMSYGLSFLSITATITHAVIYFWKPIQIQFKRSLREQPDIHAQLMSNYSQGASALLMVWPALLTNNIVPEWYYACIFGELFQCRISVVAYSVHHSVHFRLCVRMRASMGHRVTHLGADNCASHWYVFSSPCI